MIESKQIVLVVALICFNEMYWRLPAPYQSVYLCMSDDFVKFKRIEAIWKNQNLIPVRTYSDWGNEREENGMRVWQYVLWNLLFGETTELKVLMQY